MRILNTTPYRVAEKPAMYTPGKPFMTVIVKGTFELVAGGPVVALPKKKQAKIGKPRNFMDRHGNSPKTPTDIAPFKPRADCLFVGSAHAPGGEPVEVLDVAFSVGPMRKALSVHGDRQWVRQEDGGIHLSTPKPFVSLPIRAEYAHGGVDSRFNRHGIGFESLDMAPGSAVDVANIVAPGETATPFDQDVAHQGFGMLAPFLLPRRELLGTTDRKWLVRRKPLPPHDFDVGFFNAAPSDQQIEGYLQGDEAIVLENLHPELPVFRSQLPGTRIRMFIHRSADPNLRSEHEVAEVRTVLDTCVVDATAGTVTLVSRGTVEITSRDLDPIHQLLVVEEPLGAPRSAKDYAAMLHDLMVDNRQMAAEALAEERKQKVAAIEKQGLADALKALKDGGAPGELIAAVEREDTLQGAQIALTKWIEGVSRQLGLPPPPD